MLTPKYVSTIATMCMTIFLIPGIDTMIIGMLIFFVILVSLLVNLFFFWKPMRKILFQELLSQFYIDLYKNDDFVDFLVAKRNARKKKVEHVEPA